jgi:very-short-patch-repair endonuclease
MTKLKFLEKSRSIHGYKYNYPSLSDKILSSDEIEVEYNGVIYKQKVSKHINMKRCPEKNIPRKTTEQFISECVDVWGSKYDYTLVEYRGALKKIKIIYEGVIFEQCASSHLRGLSPEKNLSQDNFIRKSKKIHGDRYDYTHVKFISGNDPVLIGYSGIFYIQKAYDHLKGGRPENIPLSIRKTTKKFICESQLIHDFKYNYNKTKYIKNDVKVIITCLSHGDFLQSPRSHILQRNGCPSCNEPRGEKEIDKFLKKNNITYDRQHKFNDCKNIRELPFDFYIPSMRCLIEFDGEQHFRPVKFFGGQEAYESLKINDKIKSDYCEENYINLIRIRYDQIDHIHEILWNNLKYHIQRLKLVK